jgi:MFS family permease
LKRLADRKNLSHQGSEADSIGWEVWKIVIVAMLGPFLSVLDATVVNVSLSSLATELHSSLSVIQWVASGYLLSLALVLPLSGWLVDRVGARNAKRAPTICAARKGGTSVGRIPAKAGSLWSLRVWGPRLEISEQTEFFPGPCFF